MSSYAETFKRRLELLKNINSKPDNSIFNCSKSIMNTANALKIVSEWEARGIITREFVGRKYINSLTDLGKEYLNNSIKFLKYSDL